MANEPVLLLLLARIAAIAVPATALVALLPLVARSSAGVSASEYRIIGAAMGVAAVAVATLLPSLRARFGPDLVALGGTAVMAGGLAGVGSARSLPLLVVGAAMSGMGQIAAFSTTFSVVQAVLPGWVRGRRLAMAMLVFQGMSMVGALSWGAVASATGSSDAMLIAAAVALALAAAVWPLRLAGRAEIDLTPVPLGALHHVVPVDAGPVLVSVEWPVDADRRPEFVAAMGAIRRIRRRDGAMQWGLFEDVDEPGNFVEQFTVATWAEHRRQHDRPTAADRKVQDLAAGFLTAGQSVRATHRVAARPSRSRAPRDRR